jgi:hypothetical protein
MGTDMISIVYSVEVDKAKDEKEWLRLQKISAACEVDYDFVKQRNMARFGMIVNSDSALAVKLRHNLDRQYKYVPR